MSKLKLFLTGTLVVCCAFGFLYMRSSDAGVYFIQGYGDTGFYNQNNENYNCPSNYKTCSDPYIGLGASCGGKYVSCQCPTNYMACQSPRIGDGIKCDGVWEDCICPAKYSLAPETDCLYPLTVGGESCDGKYAKCDCPDDWVTSCPSPKVLKGGTCQAKTTNSSGGKIVSSTVYRERCECPETLVTCAYPLMGEGVSCDGKWERCKCPSNYVKCSNGAEIGAASCADTEGAKYTQCKNPGCSDGGYLAGPPDGKTCNSVIYGTNTCYDPATCTDTYKTCTEAVAGYLSKNPSTYNEIYKGLAISGSGPIITEDTNGTFSHFEGKTAIPAVKFANQFTAATAETRAMHKLCTGIPTLKFSSSSTVNSGKYYYFESLKLSFSSLTNNGNFRCYNCNIDISGTLTTNKGGDFSLTQNVSYPNYGNQYIKAGYMDLYGPYISTGYDVTASTSIQIGDSSNKFGYTVVFAGSSSSSKIAVQTPFMKINYAPVAFSYAVANVKKALIGVNGSRTTAESSLSATGDTLTPVVLSNSEWRMYDSSGNNTLYLGGLAILGYKSGIDRNSTANDGSRIVWSNGTTSVRCRLVGRQNHCHKGTNSCNNRLNGSPYSYAGTSGYKYNKTHGDSCSEWCKDEGGSNPINKSSVGKIYNKNWSWIKGGDYLNVDCI